MSVLKEYHDAGWNPPKVMFYTNTASGKTVERLYEAIYKPGFAPETWFRLNGKPVIVAKIEECSEELKDFFSTLENVTILPFSAGNGDGLDTLKGILEKACK